MTCHFLSDAVVADAYQTWRTDGIDAKIDPDALYTQTTQFERFEALLGSKAQAEKYIEPGKTFLNRGHLTPRGDGIFQTWKHATFFYTNAIPQWNASVQITYFNIRN